MKRERESTLIGLLMVEQERAQPRRRLSTRKSKAEKIRTTFHINGLLKTQTMQWSLILEY